jgi:carboxymethylenebutenolidase
MTETRTETYAHPDGRVGRFTIAEPENVVRGGLVLLHPTGGTAQRRLLARSLAADGWLVAAPASNTSTNATAESVLDEADLAFGWLAERGVAADLTGVVGFGIGGSAAMAVAARRRIGASVSIAARGLVVPLCDGIPPLVDIAGGLTCPWLGIYAEADDHVDRAEIEKLRDAAAGSGVATNVLRFAEVDHGFDADGNATEIGQRTLSWFDAHLR